MQMDDMILVSIDDHMIEPPDMYKNHVPAKWLDQAPKVVRNDAGRRRVGVPGRGDLDPVRHGRHRRLAPRGVGLQPRLVLRAAPRLLRRARARARHERQRRAGVDELPDDGRASTPARSPRPATRSSSLVMLQAYNDWAIDEWCARLPGPVHPARASCRCGTSTSRSRRSTGSPRRGAARSASSRRRTCRASRASCPATGTRCCRRSATRTWCCRCTSAPASTSSRRRPRRRSTTSWCSPARSARITAQDLLFGPTLRQFPDLQGRAVRGRHRLDPLLPRPRRPPLPEPGVAARRRLRRQAAVRGVPRAHPRLLHHRPVGARCCATASASTSSPGSATTPTPTRRGRSRPSSPGTSSRTPGCTDEEIHKITWENACRFFDWDPFEHTPKEQATVGALRALATDVDTTRMSRAEWRSATRPPASARSDPFSRR